MKVSEPADLGKRPLVKERLPATATTSAQRSCRGRERAILTRTARRSSISLLVLPEDGADRRSCVSGL